MIVFDLQVPEQVLEAALGSAYRSKLKILKFEFLKYRDDEPQRLGLLTLTLDTADGIKSLEVIVKESTKHELLITSIANKLFPYNSPKVIYHELLDSKAWLLLENIKTWVDVCDRHRVNETLLDGLYEIHRVTFDNTAALIECFDIPILTNDILYRRASSMLEEIQPLYEDKLFVEVFTEDIKTLLFAAKEKLKGMQDLAFPYVLAHSNYNPNSTRALQDSNGNYHVVVYDWVNSIVGWPQTDLVILLDRLQFAAFYQGLPDPSSILLERYLEHLLGDFNVDTGMFFRLYKLCCICNALAVIRWWMRMHYKTPSQDPERAFLEIRAKFSLLQSL